MVLGLWDLPIGYGLRVARESHAVIGLDTRTASISVVPIGAPDVSLAGCGSPAPASRGAGTGS